MRLIRITRELQKCIFYTYSSISIHSIRNSDHFFPVSHSLFRIFFCSVPHFIDIYSFSLVCLFVVVGFQFEIALDVRSHLQATTRIDHIKINLSVCSTLLKYNAISRWIVAFMRLRYHNRHLFKSTTTRTQIYTKFEQFEINSRSNTYKIW